MVRRRGPVTLLFAAALAAIFFVMPAPPADASMSQVTIVQDDARLDANPAATLNRLRLIGAQAVRVSVAWSSIAPMPKARRAPAHFDATNPAAYPASHWRLWDAIVTEAQRDGITVDFDLMGGAPQWAVGPGRPAGNSNPNWEPSPTDYGQFVRAIGTRYSGSYIPAGRSSPLPRVNFWSIWNEPDYGPSLAPQGVPGDLSVENSPRMYRNLVGAAWNGLRASGHGPSTDTILFGELAPRGQTVFGVFSGMTPLAFLRALYCVNAGYRELRGFAAKIRGCPATAAGSRRFRAENPALFSASGVADHPYMRWYPPNREPNPDPTNHLSTRDYSTLGTLGNLTKALDRLVAVYGAQTHLPIYDTEFGYITSPPKHSPDPSNRIVRYLSPATVAAYMNQAEYMSWRNPRLRSFDQYLLYDPNRPSAKNDWGGFASGVLTWNGAQKVTYAALRLPLYLPVSTTRSGKALEVWGCVRPAPFGALDTNQPQTAEIQFAPRSGGPYTTLDTVTIAAGGSCYFDQDVVIPSSGTVRLAYTYPAIEPFPAGGVQVFSRVVAVKVR